MAFLRQLGNWATVLMTGLLAACQPASQKVPLAYSQAPATIAVPIYRLAVQPLVDHLNAQWTNAPLELEASRDYPAFEAKYALREPAFLLPNPWQTLQAMTRAYHVIAMAGDAKDFKGIFVVRRDSSLKQPADLKGKVVSYPSSTALAACIMPQYFLHKQGLDVLHDIQNVYVGSQESSIMNAYLGQAAAQLKVIWETESLVNNWVMVRDDVPAPVRSGLLGLAQTPAGQTVLAGMATASFQAANDASYDQVARYIERFERDVRPIVSPP